MTGEATSMRGRLLVAEATLADPNFRRSVVYIIEHAPDSGALGLILNRPGEVPVRDAVPQWAPYVNGIDRVFEGGPVTPEGAICLAWLPNPGPGIGGQPALEDDCEEPLVFRPITDAIGAIDLHADPTEAPSGIRELRIFAGYAGWSPGQLEAELDAGGWYVLDAGVRDVFSQSPQSLWRDVLRRQTGSMRAVAHYPEDPSWN